jgi:hypothetical protein
MGKHLGRMAEAIGVTQRQYRYFERRTAKEIEKGFASLLQFGFIKTASY